MFQAHKKATGLAECTYVKSNRFKVLSRLPFIAIDQKTTAKKKMVYEQETHWPTKIFATPLAAAILIII